MAIFGVISGVTNFKQINLHWVFMLVIISLVFRQCNGGQNIGEQFLRIGYSVVWFQKGRTEILFRKFTS